MKTRKLTCILGLMALSFFSTAADYAVTVNINQNTYSFTERPRLAKVLEPVALQTAWYWPASRLYRVNEAITEAKRAELVTLLNALKSMAKPEEQAIYQQLYNQISNWQLAEFIPVAIDYDRARALLQHNPLFEPGQYQLTLTTRPVEVLFWGAVAKPVSEAHRQATPVDSYLSDIERHNLADTSRVFIIQPNGVVIEQKLGAWQNHVAEVMPGSTVYVPFASGLFSAELAQLNNLLIALAVNRIY